MHLLCFRTFIKHTVRRPGEGRRGESWRPGGADQVTEASQAGEGRPDPGQQGAGHHGPSAFASVLFIVIVLEVILLVLDIELALTFALLDLYSEQVVRFIGPTLRCISSSIRSIMIYVRL